jgi:hypothetical protein
VGNPLQPTGKFFDVSRSPTWSAVKITALEHPNVVERREVIPGAVTQKFIDLMAQEYGAGSGVYQARVQAEFPDEADDTLVQRSWMVAANDRWRALRGTAPQGRPVFALDPARYGPDSSVLAVRYGELVEELVTWNKLGTVETAGRVVVEMERFGLPRPLDPLTVASENLANWRASYTLTVDEPGLGGGVVDVLRELKLRVVPYNGGRTPSKPQDAARFRNARARDFWNLRRRLECGTIALPPDDRLADELCAMRWRLGMDQRVEIEAKDDLRGRLGRSPDRADAVAMVFADDGRSRLLVA